MAKTLTIKYNGREYLLEYTRSSIKRMESQGFNIGDIDDKPVSTLTALFEGAFYANHAKIRPSELEEIYDSLSDKEGLLKCLAEMYSEPLEALMSDPVGDSGNATWGASWR